MISRLLVVIASGALWIGPTSAPAQVAGTGLEPQQQKPAAEAQEPASVGDDATALTDPGATKDPFDSAAAKMKASEPRSLGADGKGDSVGSSKGKTEKATFGAGCFWHVEAEFEWLPGVKSAVSGYSGGAVAYPSYEEVHEGVTGHAEVVQVEYDPAVISYEQLLKVFWSGHDPTQLNRQGPDVGTQYRSVIFFHTPEQREAALKSYRQLTAARVFHGQIVTQLLPMKSFFRAEDYHQNYYGGKDDRPAVRSSRSKRLRKPAVKPATAKPASSAINVKQRVPDGGAAKSTTNSKAGTQSGS
ncbi:MAG: peptide-methionine (S)-S-oxide reductase MsrA [Isosphaeraceae bacterium]